MTHGATSELNVESPHDISVCTAVLFISFSIAIGNFSYGPLIL